MNHEFIKYDDPIFSVWRENYLDGSTERRYCIIQDFKRENQLKSDYLGREILELVQNADDQKSDCLEIKVVTIGSDPRIVITNKGPNTIPFSRDGFRSIMRPDLSSKQLVTGNFAEGETIGNKGLGFRSVLNWSSHIEIESAGLHCDFNENTAWSKWTEIKRKLEDDGCDELLKNCLAVAKDKCPISLLATPEVKMSNTDSLSTSITIHFDPTHEKSIISQINDLRPNILFFVRNIKQIKISVNNNVPRIMRRSDWEEKKRISSSSYVSYCVLSDGGSEKAWLKYNFQDADFEIAISWREDGTPVDKDECFFYSFFPTKVRLNLPCIIHANVDLDASRNNVLPTDRNKKIMFLVGKCLTHVAEYIAECNEFIEKCDWHPYKMLFISDDELLDPVNQLVNGINEVKDNAKIFPTVRGKYVTLSNSCCYCRELAEFLLKHRDFNYFENHLQLGWEELSIKKEDNIYVFNDIIFKLLGEICTMAQENEQRAIKIYSEIIEIIVQLKKKYYYFRIDFLPDCNWNIITGNTAYINCGQILHNAPDFLDIKYVNPHLVDFCCSEESAFKANDNRDMVKRLRDICDVSASDINQMKERIINFSKNEQCKEPECFKKIIKCLYETFLKSVSLTGVSDGIGYDFFVLAENGCQYHANEVTLWDESRTTGLAAMLPENKNVSSRWRLYGTLQSWCEYLKCSEDDAVVFFGNFIGISLGLPLQRVYCGDDNSFVQESISGTNLDAWDFTKQRLGERNSTPNNCFIICADVIPELIDSFQGLRGIIPFIKILFEDKKCYDILISSPNQCYFQRIVRWQRFESSYMSYKLRSNSFLKPLKRYAIEEDLSAEGIQLCNSFLLKDIPVDQRRILLGKLGAAQSLKDMSIEDLYEMLSVFQGNRSIQKFYQRVREALRYHIDSARNSEEKDFLEKKCTELAIEKLDRLWAHKGRCSPELVSRDEIYYWDNDILSKQLLDKLYKLEIGSRIGADSVVKLFGVKRLRHESVSIKSKIINQELTAAIQSLLLSRRHYLLATRVPLLDDEKIPDAVTALKNLDIEVVTTCVYGFNDETYTMTPGELIQTENNRFVICSEQQVLSAALSKPEFCMALGEMLCIQFKLTGAQIAGEFRTILKSSDEEIEYYMTREVSESDWERVSAALGLDEEECLFWQGFLKRSLNEDEKEQLTSEKTRSYCIEKLVQKKLDDEMLGCIPLKEMNCDQAYAFVKWLNLNDYKLTQLLKARLYEYFQKELTVLAEKYLKSFASLLHRQKTASLPQDQQTYCFTLEDYSKYASEWLEPDAKSLTEQMPLCNNDEIYIRFFASVKKRYGVDLSQANPFRDEAPTILTEYTTLLESSDITSCTLDAELKSLLFFSGNVEKLREYLKTENVLANECLSDNKQDNSLEKVQSVNFEDIVSLENQTLEQPISIEKAKRKSGCSRGKGIDYATSGELKAKGTKAERLALLAITERSDRFLNVKIWSSLSNTHGYADDSRHYDISYETPSGERRYLEIKATENNGFIMSHAEFETATSEEYQDFYDLALVNVHESKVRFFMAPFSKKSNFQNIKASPETWSIEIK